MSKIAKALSKAAEQRQPQAPAQPSVFPIPVAAAAEEVPIPVYSQTAVQHMSLQGECLLSGNLQDSILCDSINILRAQVLHLTRHNHWNTILITSPNPGAGKTTIATNLAISLAREINQTSLLVDLNMRAPGVMERMGLNEELGLYDYLIDGTPLDQLFVNPGIAKLVVLPAGRPLEGVAEMLGAPRMKSLIKELKHRYPERYVIIDSPHVIGLPDVLVCAEYVDAILLVVGEHETKREELEQTLNLLEQRNILGVVLNKSR